MPDPTPLTDWPSPPPTPLRWQDVIEIGPLTSDIDRARFETALNRIEKLPSIQRLFQKLAQGVPSAIARDMTKLHALKPDDLDEEYRPFLDAFRAIQRSRGTLTRALLTTVPDTVLFQEPGDGIDGIANYFTQTILVQPSQFDDQEIPLRDQAQQKYLGHPSMERALAHELQHVADAIDRPTLLRTLDRGLLYRSCLETRAVETENAVAGALGEDWRYAYHDRAQQLRLMHQPIGRNNIVSEFKEVLADQLIPMGCEVSEAQMNARQTDGTPSAPMRKAITQAVEILLNFTPPKEALEILQQEISEQYQMKVPALASPNPDSKAGLER